MSPVDVERAGDAGAVGGPTEAGLARAMRVSLVSQLAAKGLHLLLNVVASLAIVRYLGPRAYGDYVIVLTTTGLTTLVADAGLHKLAVREVARRPDAAERITGTVVAIRVVLAIGAAGLAQVVLLPLGAAPVVHQATLIASGMGLVEASLGAVVVFHVSLRQHYEAGVRTVMEVVELVVIVAVIRSGGSLVALAAAPVVGGAVGVVLAHAVGRARFGFRLRVDRSLVRSLLRGALPLAPALFVGVAVLKVDGLLVAALRPRADTGAYGAAWQPVEYAFLGITVVAFPFLPVLARWFRDDPGRFAVGYQQGTQLVLALVAIVPLAVLPVGGPLVETVYDSGWSSSVTPLRLLSLALLPMALVAWHGVVLLAGDRQGAVLPCMLLALAVSTAGCLLVVPALGPPGAAGVVLAAHLVALVWVVRRTSRLLGVGLHWRGPAVVVATAAVAGSVVLALSATVVGWPVAVSSGLVLYVVVLRRTRLLDLGVLEGAAAAGPASPLPAGGR